MADSRWSPKIFAMLLEEAKGVRSWRQFSADCDISYVQMRKLAMCEQVNPPRPKLIRKVAMQAFGEIDLEDLLFAAGIKTGESMAMRDNEETEVAVTAYDKYRSLPPKERKTIDKFINFLVSEYNKSEEQ